MSSSSTNPEPPPDWMLPEFDPNKARVSELRSILLENNIPHSYTRKSDLVQLFERQVKPMTPKLLRDHRNVKASAEGIIDMRTGQTLQADGLLPQSTPRSPRKRIPNPVNLTDQESLTPSTATSRRRTRQQPLLHRSSKLDPEEAAASEADGEFTPDSSVLSRSRIPLSAKSRSGSTPTLPTAHQSSKRKAQEIEQLELKDHDDEELNQLAAIFQSEDRDIDMKTVEVRAQSSMVKPSASPSTSAPVKRRKSEFLIPSSTATHDDDEPSISRKSVTKPKNRRTTLHEVIEAGDANYSDYNPFQSTPDDDKSGSSGKKPKSSTKRKSTIPRPSIASAQLPKSSITSTNSTLDSPAKAGRSTLPHHAPRLSYSSQTPIQPTFSAIPKSATTSNIRAMQQTPTHPASRSSGPFPTSVPPTHKLLTRPHLQDDQDMDQSFENGTPEQVYRQLVPGGGNERFQQHEELGDQSAEIDNGDTEYLDHQQALQRSSISYPQSVRQRIFEPNSPELVRQPYSARRQSHIAPRTPYQQQNVILSQRAVSHQTPIPRPTIDRIRMDGLVQQTPSSVQRLKIKRATPQPSTSKLPINASQVISFMLKLALFGVVMLGVAWYLNQSRRLGYCDTGMSSNSITRDQRIEEFLEDGDDVEFEENNIKRSIKLYTDQVFEACRTIGILPDCQSCPTNAICEKGKILGCEKDFVLKEGSQFDIRLHSWIPSLGGPSCVPDTLKLITIIETAGEIHHLLKRRAGDVICNMGMKAIEVREKSLEGEKVEAKFMETYGIREEVIKNQMKMRLGGDRNEEEREEIIELAIKELERQQSKESRVYRREGWMGLRDLKKIEIGWRCGMKLWVYRLIDKFKLVLMSLVLGLIGVCYGNIKMDEYRREKMKIKELVEISLNKLKEQSWIHHTNPSLQPQPMIASAHLRDLILSYEHSAMIRQRLWKKVEKIIEGNSNVRIKLSEQRGENIKVWEWIGSYSGDLHSEPNRQQINSH